MPKVNGLTRKQELFVLAFCSNGFNATDAAAQAKYKGNRQTLQVVGAENLAKPMIADAIEKRLADARPEGEYDVTVWLREVRENRKAAKTANNHSAVTACDRLLGLYAGTYKADNEQKRAQSLLAIQIQQEQQERRKQAVEEQDAEFEKIVATLKALETAPDAMAR